jgi:hypothetical protein
MLMMRILDVRRLLPCVEVKWIRDNRRISVDNIMSEMSVSQKEAVHK